LRPRFYEGGCVGFGEGEGAHFFDVCTCGERFLAAGEENCRDIWALVEGLEGVIKFVDEGRGDGVEGFGAVESY
jgi:hypothetical protein